MTAWVPSLMMVNREQCCVTTFYPWICRQLLTIRLHHPAWRLLAGLGLHWGELIAVLMAMEIGVRRRMAARGEPTAWLGLCGLARTVPALDRNPRAGCVGLW